MSNEEIITEVDKGLETLKKGLSKMKQALSSANQAVLQAEAYNKGLNDGRNEVWEFAKKLFCPPRYNGIDGKTLSVLFEMDIHNVPARYTVQEALAKLEAYEKEQNEIKVGDVVISDAGHKALVVGFDKGNKDGIFVMRNDGVTGLRVKQSYTKTGKHIDIQSVLEQIKE